ncbi:hypothetical protein E2C01_087474 [Portunus trituberculatus]|uniref:Uncharacterized protein n=1 Tax=Portunus trituberculatus TaxID=210409 RepID=A0A5B7JE49_PORTR|nr:hypothetical protein [Portunus trituberculatus]
MKSRVRRGAEGR